MDDKSEYIYIIITNNNSYDFQSYIIKYQSWDKFINDIQDINFKDTVCGTMMGLLHPRNAVAIIDFKDEFHAKYHFNTPFHKEHYTTAYVVDKIDMEYIVGSENYRNG